MTFVNHGCNGTFNIIEWNSYVQKYFLTEQDVTPGDYSDWRAEVYDLSSDRHQYSSGLGYSVATRDIKAGEEILSNYVFYTSEEHLWWEDVMSIKRICSGEEVGFITKTEQEA